MKGGIWWSGRENNSGGIAATYLYRGATNGSGQFSVTFPEPFENIPNVHPHAIGGGSRVNLELSRDTAGFTVTATTPVVYTLLGIEILRSTTVPISGLVIDVAVFSND